MAEPTIDSLSQTSASPQGAASVPEQPVTPMPPEHIEVPPIGPAPQDTTLPTTPKSPPSEALGDDVATAGPSPELPPLEVPKVAPKAAAQPVIETHKGSVPVMPLPGQANPSEQPQKLSSVTQRPVYLWALLFVGVIFLALLFFVYFGGAYQA